MPHNWKQFRAILIATEYGGGDVSCFETCCLEPLCKSPAPSPHCICMLDVEEMVEDTKVKREKTHHMEGPGALSHCREQRPSP